MKVLIVFNHPAPYKVNIFNEMAKYVDLTVLFERTKAKNRPQDFYVANKFNFTHFFLKDGYVFNEGSLSNGVRKFIKEHHDEYDQIVMNGYSHVAEIKAINYMKKHHISFSLLINGGIAKDKEFFLKRKFKSKMISSASFYMSPSSKSDDYLVAYGANKNRIYRYPYSNLSESELHVKHEDKVATRKDYNIPLDKTVFVNASQFIERKNNMQLLSIFNGRKEFLILIGQGNQQEQYEQFIAKNNMENVMIIPFKKKDELFRILRSCDVFITLAKEDIFGHTTLEALSCGLPVVSSNKVISSLEYIQNGKNGYIVDLNNKQEIVSAIENAPKISKDNTLDSIKNNTYESCGKRLADILIEENTK